MAPVFWLEVVLFSITLIVSAALALMVWSFGPKRMLNITFALYAASSAAWALASILLRLTLGLGLGNTQVIQEGAIVCFGLMGLFLLPFTVRYLDLNTRRADQAVAAGVVALIVFAVPLFNHQLVSNPRVSSNGVLLSDVNLGAILVAVLLPGVYLIWSTVLFWQKRQRTQELYLAVGVWVLLIGYAFRAFNVPVPALSLAGTLSCCVMGYGILSRQLFNPLKERTLALQREVAERQRMGEALRRAEEKYRSIVEDAVEGIFQSTPEGRFLSVNPAMARMYGYAGPDDMIHSVVDITRQVYADPEQRVHLQQRLETEGVVQSFEMQDRRRDGGIFWTSMNVRVVRDAQGKTLYYEGTLEDITARKQAEESLKQANATLQALIDSAPLAIIMLDLNSRVLLWNKAAQEMYGWTADEVWGEFLPNISDDKLEEHLAIRARVLGGETITSLEVERRRKDGSRIQLGLSIAPLKDSTGQIYAQMSIGIDITEHKRAEETLQMFQYTIDRASDAVQWLNREGGFEYVNDQACRSLDYTREELLRLRLWDIDPIYPKERWDKNWESYQDGRRGGSENVETLHRRKDGSVFPVEVSSNHLWFGEKELHVAVVRDITERRQAEQEIQNLARFPAENPNPVLRLNQDGSILYANEASQPLLQDWAVEVGGQAPQFWQDRVADALGSQSKRTLEVRCGELVYSFVVLPVSQAGYVNLYAIDITERKQAEEALRESEESYRRLVEVSPVAMWINQDGIITYMNPAALQILGATDLQQVVGRAALDFVHPDYHAIVKERTSRMVDREYIAPLLEEKYVRLDGSVVDVEVTATPFTTVGGRAIQVLFQDITQRRQTEQILHLRLRLMEYAVTHSLAELLQKTLDEVGELTNSPIGFYHFVEADQRTLSLQAWSTRTLNEFCEAEGKGLHYPIDQAGVWTDCVRERRPVIHNDYSSLPHRKGLPEGHAQVRRELVVPILRGNRIVAILGVGNKAQVYTEKDIEVVSYVADVAWEITERKRVEAEREKLISDLEAKNAELERFTYTVSHDLKSPLITIRGFLGFLEKDAQGGDVEQMQADMKRIIEATDRMQRLLSELLELSRIGRIVNPPEAVPFETIVHEALALVRGSLQARGVNVQVAAELPIVHGDRTRLVEVVQNLVDNAVKFMGDQPQPYIDIGQLGFDDTGKSILFVQDNGSGIDRQYHDTVFGLFSKLDAQSEGTGVGLALVKRIVEVHGGRIWVESEGAKAGSTFYFTLPVKPMA